MSSIATTTPARSESQLKYLMTPRILLGGGLLLLILALCYGSLFWTAQPTGTFSYQSRNNELAKTDGYDGVSPRLGGDARVWFGTDHFGRSVLARCLFGGTISLGVGVSAAAIAVFLGVSIGLISGYRGGWIDTLLMRSVDILYGLPYVLLVLLFKIALEPPLLSLFRSIPSLGIASHASQITSFVVMFLAIGLVSWLTMARVIRAQVMSLRGQPFIEAARAVGLPGWRIFLRHVLPNLVGPITVYATLTVPSAMLQESFLSFLGVGIDQTLPTWGSLASEYRTKSLAIDGPRWWMLGFPVILLALTLLSLNFLGDGLRDLFDPKREAAKL
ncbi:MAG: ABC transporter permease [Tepidisphaeraceae bacterium]